jgi:hypothetical protein
MKWNTKEKITKVQSEEEANTGFPNVVFGSPRHMPFSKSDPLRTNVI